MKIPQAAFGLQSCAFAYDRLFSRYEEKVTQQDVKGKKKDCCARASHQNSSRDISVHGIRNRKQSVGISSGC